MVRRARFRNSLLLAILLYSCADRPPVIPSAFVSMNDPHLRQSNGQLYFYGKPFSGHLFSLYPAGDTASAASYYEGREEGLQRQWYAGGALREERLYAQGKKQGTHIGWWPDGRRRFVYHFNRDENEGEAQEWFASGRPYRVFHYHEGQEDGRQQMWWDDGRVRANYVLKDGQQYGLIGRKLCKNPVHETN